MLTNLRTLCRRWLCCRKVGKLREEAIAATSKTAEEYASVSEEAMRLREECSKLKGCKISAEQLEQRSVQLASAEEKNHKLETECSEVHVLKSPNDDLQIQLQLVEAQKQSLEQRAQIEAGLRDELRDLKLEKIRLEGELDTATSREEAMSAVQQLRVKAAEAELEQSQRQVKKLQDRADSWDSLRTELLSRIESRSAASASNRPSIMLNEDGRKSLLNQRELFEKLKQQFDEATAIDKEVEPEIILKKDRELELEEELRRARKEQVELNIKLKSALAKETSHFPFRAMKSEMSVVLPGFLAQYATKALLHLPRCSGRTRGQVPGSEAAFGKFQYLDSMNTKIRKLQWQCAFIAHGC